MTKAYTTSITPPQQSLTGEVEQTVLYAVRGVCKWYRVVQQLRTTPAAGVRRGAVEWGGVGFDAMCWAAVGWSGVGYSAVGWGAVGGVL
jgi:hypothetical protein